MIDNPTPTPPDPYETLIALIKSAGKWPTPADVEINTNPPGALTLTITGNVRIVVNGSVVQSGS